MTQLKRAKQTFSYSHKAVLCFDCVFFINIETKCDVFNCIYFDFMTYSIIISMT